MCVCEYCGRGDGGGGVDRKEEGEDEVTLTVFHFSYTRTYRACVELAITE